MSAFDPLSLLDCLIRHRVEFAVVGGVAAVLRGAPINTFDRDVLYELEKLNIDRLLAALRELDARFRERPDLAPDETHVRSRGHKLLLTRHGPLDLLGHVSPGSTFEDLVEDCDWMDVEGRRVRVVRLGRLIAIKEAVGRPKDLAAPPTLRATLAESGSG